MRERVLPFVTSSEISVEKLNGTTKGDTLLMLVSVLFC